MRARRAPRRRPAASAPRGDDRASSAAAASPRRTGGPCVADPVPLGEGEGGGLDRRGPRPAAPGTRSRRPRGTRGPETPGSRSPWTRTPSAPAQGRRRAPRRSAAARWSGPAWRGRRRRPGRPPGRASSPPPGSSPRRAGGPGRAPWRSCAQWLRTPSRSPREDGPLPRGCRRTPGLAVLRVGRRSGRCGGTRERTVAVEQRHQLGYGGPGGDLAGVPGVHTAEQGLHEPVDDLLAEPLLDQVADADVALTQLGRPAARCPWLRERGPLAEMMPSSVRRSSGTPISVRGIGTSRPRFHRFADVVAGCTRSVAEADLTGQARRPRDAG